MRAVDLLGSFTFLELFVYDVCLRVLCLFVSGVWDIYWTKNIIQRVFEKFRNRYIVYMLTIPESIRGIIGCNVWRCR